MPLPKDGSSPELLPYDMAFFSWNLATDKVYGDAVLAELFDVDAILLADGFPILPMVERIAGDDRARVAQSIHQAITSGKPYRERYRIDHSRRGRIEVLAAGRCLKDAHGTPSVYNGTVVELASAGASFVSDPLENHCQSALDLAMRRGNELAVRYLSSALRVIGSVGKMMGPR